MGTFRRSRSPGALPLILALMDSFRTEKLKTKDRALRTHVLIIGHPGGGKGGGGEYSILQWPILEDSSRKGYFFRPQVHPNVGLSLVEVYERVGKSVILAPGILVGKKAQKG